MGKTKSLFPVTWIPRTSRGRFFILAAALATAVAILCPPSLSAQTEIKICGRITDFESGAPVEGATVTIDGIGRSVSSDQTGSFEFGGIPSGHYIVRAGRVGYALSDPITIDINSDLPFILNITLDPEPIKVGDQVVSAPRPEPIHTDRAGNITRISVRRGELKTIEDLVRVVPELELVGSGQQRLLRIRGSQSNAVLVMLDGRIQNSALVSTGDLSAIPLASISEVEVTRGGDYDRSGLAGSVNFKTYASQQEDRISSTAERGSFGRESYSANLDKSHKSGISAGIDIGSVFSRGDFKYVDPRGQAQTRDNNYFHDRKLFGQAGYSGQAFSLEIKGRYFERRSGIPGPVFQYTPLATSCEFERELYLIAKRKPGNGLAMDINGGILSRTISYQSPASPTSFIPYNSDFSERSRDMKIEIRRHGHVRLNGATSIRHETLEGADRIRPDASFGHHSRDIITAGLGAQASLPALNGFLKNSSANIGLRAERAGANTFWGPSIAAHLSFSLPARPAFDLALFRSQRLPNLTDLYWKEDVFATPNPGLRPERSTGYEIGLGFNRNSSWLSAFGITRFETWYNDIIVWRRWGGDKFKPVNLSAAIISGWEIRASIRPFSGPIEISWNGNFIKPINREQNTVYYGKYLTFRPIGSQRIDLDLGLGEFKISVSGRHIGRRYMTEENTKSLASVDILDISIHSTFGMAGLEIVPELNVLNVSDRRYEILERVPEKPREINARIQITRLGEGI